jgi:hypothetical protein
MSARTTQTTASSRKDEAVSYFPNTKELMMTDQSKPPKQVPLDILQVDRFLQEFRTDLTDVMMMAVDEWSAVLRDDIRIWLENNGLEPGWQSFRDWMNEICREDAMPVLFPNLPPESISEEKTENSPESNSQASDLAGFVAGKGEAHDYLPDWMPLPPLYHNENHPNPLAVIKLFTPDSSWRWFLMEYDGDDLLFGLVAGLETELGYVSLRELQRVTGPMGLHIERDLWFRPTPVRELPEYKERWGNSGPYPGEPPVPDPPPDSPTPTKPSNSAVPPQTENHTTPPQELPDGWTSEDIRFLLDKLAEGPILVAESGLGIPTIHEDFGAETRHLGFGLMQVTGDGYTLRFDAGGAMQHTPASKSWTRLSIKGQYNGYDCNTVRQTLSSWLSPESKPDEVQPWQMTRLIYQQSKALQVVDGVPVLNGADGEAHEHLVRAALARGEVVPAEVLADYPDLLPEARGSLSSTTQLGDEDNHQQVTDAAAGHSLAEVAALVPEMSGVDIEGQPISQAQVELERWELALLTGMVDKRDSAFYQALNAIAQSETLEVALDRIPATDTHRRALVEKQLAALRAQG